MLLNFLEREHLEDYHQLEEKLIIVGKGQNYGQIMFMAGGAGSGKGFAIKNFIQGEKFKVRDVDEWKTAMMKVGELKNKYPEIKGLNLRKPEDVFKLHMFVKEKGIKDKSLDAILGDAKSRNAAKRGILPNILFDITMAEVKDVSGVIPQLRGVGYDPKNIHLTWVLTDYNVAVKNNAERSRVVPADILLQTHVGAAESMVSVIRGKTPRGLGGAVNVILNNRENTIPFTDAKGNVIKGTGSKQMIVKDFTYLNLKKEGKGFTKDAAIQKQLFAWIKSNVPDEALKTIKEPEL